MLNKSQLSFVAPDAKNNPEGTRKKKRNNGSAGISVNNIKKRRRAMHPINESIQKINVCKWKNPCDR